MRNYCKKLCTFCYVGFIDTHLFTDVFCAQLVWAQRSCHIWHLQRMWLTDVTAINGCISDICILLMCRVKIDCMYFNIIYHLIPFVYYVDNVLEMKVCCMFDRYIIFQLYIGNSITNCNRWWTKHIHSVSWLSNRHLTKITSFANKTKLLTQSLLTSLYEWIRQAKL